MESKDRIVSRKKAIIALSQTKGIGYYSIRQLYLAQKNLEDLRDLKFNELLFLFKKAKIKYADSLANDFFINKEKLFEKAESVYFNLINKRKISFILEDEHLFPQSLKIIPDNPFWLFAEGNPEILNSDKIVAVVGTRHPTPKGIRIAQELTEHLVKKDYIIVSGLALGIDEAAHSETNKLKGQGIAVLGVGINLPFPAKTYRIRKDLVSNLGVVVSEYMINDSYSKRSFFWRNRIQSGLSKVIFPIQGSLNSGTTHTIKFAETQKKKIIGVYLNEIEDELQNEIFGYLNKRGCPIYDINSELNEIISAIKSEKEEINLFEQIQLFDFEKEMKEEEAKKDVKRKKGFFKFIQSFFMKIKIKR